MGRGEAVVFWLSLKNFAWPPLQFSLECLIKPVHLPVKNLFRLQLLGCPPPFQLENFWMALPETTAPPPPTHKKWLVPNTKAFILMNSLKPESKRFIGYLKLSNSSEAAESLQRRALLDRCATLCWPCKHSGRSVRSWQIIFRKFFTNSSVLVHTSTFHDKKALVLVFCQIHFSY